MSIQQLHQRAVRAGIALVAQTSAVDLTRPTPCAGWTLADLLAHMIAQDRGFAWAARGEVTEAIDWTPQPLGAEFVAEYTATANDVAACLAAPDALDREFFLPEFSAPHRYPGRVAIEAHFIDYVVHGWDVARSLGLRFQPDPEVTTEALRIASAIKTKPPFFQPAVPVPPGAGPIDQIVAMLGRSPTWPDKSTSEDAGEG